MWVWMKSWLENCSKSGLEKFTCKCLNRFSKSIEVVLNSQNESQEKNSLGIRRVCCLRFEFKSNCECVVGARSPFIVGACSPESSTVFTRVFSTFPVLSSAIVAFLFAFFESVFFLLSVFVSVREFFPLKEISFQFEKFFALFGRRFSRVWSIIRRAHTQNQTWIGRWDRWNQWHFASNRLGNDGNGLIGGK